MAAECLIKKLDSGIDTFDILGLNVAVTNIDDAAKYIAGHAERGLGGYVCAANVHMCMESYDNNDFMQVVNNAAIVVPDGKPLFWWMKMFGVQTAQQVRGPDLFLKLCQISEKSGLQVGLYGGSEKALAALQKYIHLNYPSLNLVKLISPPYRSLAEEEQASYITEINESGVKILFVGLGCPKQEKWMASNEDSVNAIMVGVGAAFDFYAGTLKMAPEWMKTCGLEWLYRLFSEPRRLWKRYLYNNPRFILLFSVAWLRDRFISGKTYRK